jgi:hypothetical protein
MTHLPCYDLTFTIENVPSFSLINKIFADVEEKGKNFFSENHLWHLGGL